MHLIIDVGNSRTKLGFFDAHGLTRQGVVDNGDATALLAWIGVDVPERIAWGSVGAPNDVLLDRLRSMAPTLVITGATPSPMRSLYTTPATLGADRLANAVAAAAMFPARSVLAIDLGTCITYDLVRADGTYIGGAITPGQRMRAKAMNAYSARLPLVDPGPEPTLFGSSTHEALESGLHHGVLGEIKAFIAAAGHHSDAPCVVLTGGDALRFARALKSGIFAHPFLTLEGYHLILLHNLGAAGAHGRPDGVGPGPAG